MSFPYVSTGGFFTRQGVIIGEFNRVTVFYGSSLTTGVATITAQFASSDQAAIQDLVPAAAAFPASAAGYQGTLIGDGQNAVILQIGDNIQPFVPATFVNGITLVAAQMRKDSQTINRPSLADTVTASEFGTNYSDATVAISFTNPFGDQLDMTIAENIQITCTVPSPTYQETLQAIGQAVQPGTSPNWPGGSGAAYSFAISNPAASGGIVTDGAINTWGGTGNNTPTFWTPVNGATGTTIFRFSTPPVTQGGTITYCAQIHSDGASLTQLLQTLTLQPDTVYAVSFRAKASATDASGVVRIAFVDENGNVVSNDAATANSKTFTMSSGTTSATNVGSTYGIFTAFFQTPRQLPTSIGVQVGYSVAPASGVLLDFGMVGVAAVGQMYNGGPYVVAWAGNNTTALGDNWQVAITNSLTSASFALGMDRLYGMRNLGLYLPSSGSPTISDTLVTH